VLSFPLGSVTVWLRTPARVDVVQVWRGRHPRATRLAIRDAFDPTLSGWHEHGFYSLLLSGRWDHRLGHVAPSASVLPGFVLLHCSQPKGAIFRVVILVRHTNLNRVIVAHNRIKGGAIRHADLQDARSEPSESQVLAVAPGAIRVEHASTGFSTNTSQLDDGPVVTCESEILDFPVDSGGPLLIWRDGRIKWCALQWRNTATRPGRTTAHKKPIANRRLEATDLAVERFQTW
jgi:hypothetical protein